MVNAMLRLSRKLLVASIPMALLLAASAFPKARGDSVVQVSVSEEGKLVAGSPLYLEHLKDEDCAKLFSGDPGSNSDNNLSKDELRETIQRARSCVTKTQSGRTDKHGAHSYEGLEPGWYLIKLQWPMSQPPATKEPFGCTVEGWTISYVPWKDSGKNRGYAQGASVRTEERRNQKDRFQLQRSLQNKRRLPKAD